MYNLSLNVILDFYSWSSKIFYYALILLLKNIHKIEKMREKTIIKIPNIKIAISNPSPSIIGFDVINSS